MQVDMSKENLLGRKQYLLQIRQLCFKNIKVICLVGMGGICKTTIAKATFIDIKHMYDASCFVEIAQNNGDSYSISCNILKQFKFEEKPKDLNEAQEILKSFFIKNKIILVLDDVKDQSQIEVIPMDVISTSNGKSIEEYSMMIYKINIEELDEVSSIELFNSYSWRHQEKLDNEFVEVGTKIVKACNGLALSLKVMGAFLRGQKRLRYWEQALQRLKRRRDLDGDENDSDYKIWNILRISFDNLKDIEKKIFLDICCFFCNDVYPQGMKKKRALQIWAKNKEEEELEEDMDCILNTLIQKSLVKIDNKGILSIHDQLRDMGRMIVEVEAKYKSTRIWNMNKQPIHKSSNQVSNIDLI
ncbi:TMV resistance protein N [Physcomitrium patens]|uniref:TMV resistance protein N n=1 Tax=Physcomitrium patens TaxID=3218 RepID=UPI000D173FDA|nr:TMV resistance protein N-like [Physcomitrium patens]|eukprot:XP_024359161.1 TMV resistance protein N-like [Physcomitrella patens]